MRKIVVVVAGGKGTRMQSEVPKQFIDLNGYPIILHTINRFLSYNPDMEFRLVLPADQFQTWDEICQKHNFKHEIEVYPGGEVRFESVKNGISNLPKNSLVAIHDGVRPLINRTTIDLCFKRAEKYGSAIPVISPYESIRFIENDKSKPVDRSKYVLIQTPQVFKSKILSAAYNTTCKNEFTDDATVVEHAGYSVHLVEGHRENIKITSPLDLQIAEALLQQ